MNDFLNFIDKDIAAKKLAVQTLPIKTKTNIKKLNETIEEYRAKCVKIIGYKPHIN